MKYRLKRCLWIPGGDDASMAWSHPHSGAPAGLLHGLLPSSGTAHNAGRKSMAMSRKASKSEILQINSTLHSSHANKLWRCCLGLQTLGPRDTPSALPFVIHLFTSLTSAPGAKKNTLDHFQKASELVTVVSWSFFSSCFCLNPGWWCVFFSPQ